MSNKKEPFLEWYDLLIMFLGLIGAAMIVTIL